MENKLRKSLFRMFCPDSNELGEYHLGMLPDERKKFIQRHLETCPHCVRELASLEDFLAANKGDLEYSFRERVRVLIGKLIEPGSGISLTPALSPVRGTGQPALNYQAERYQVILDFEPDLSAPDKRVIQGLLLRAEEDEAFSATLWSPSEKVAAMAVDELGNFGFGSLSPGTYHLELISNQVEIKIDEFEIT